MGGDTRGRGGAKSNPGMDPLWLLPLEGNRNMKRFATFSSYPELLGDVIEMGGPEKTHFRRRLLLGRGESSYLIQGTERTANAHI